jgi:hypothetical protein
MVTSAFVFPKPSFSTFAMFSAKAKLPDSFLTERELLDLESRVCSYGDTVYYGVWAAGILDYEK